LVGPVSRPLALINPRFAAGIKPCGFPITGFDKIDELGRQLICLVEMDYFLTVGTISGSLRDIRAVNVHGASEVTGLSRSRGRKRDQSRPSSNALSAAQIGALT
jgi:hypothetical protein